MLLAFVATLAHAQNQPADKPADKPAADKPKAEKSEPTIKFGGVLFPRYTYDLTEGAGGFNGFDVDRTYLRADAKLNDRFAARLTLDASRLSDVAVTLPDGSEVTVPGDTRLRVFVKHAWLEYKPASDVRILFGMVDTPYLPYTEGIVSMRYVFKTFLDDVKVATTTDLGVFASGKHADGLFTWGVGVYNGEFFSSPEIDAGKSVQARVGLDPLAGGDHGSLPIVVFAEQEFHTGADATTVAGGTVGFVEKWLAVTAEVDAVMSGGVTGLGESGILRPSIPDVGFLVARVDHFDPDGGTDGDAQTKLWGGLGRDFTKNVSLAATYERTQLEASDVPVHGLSLHGLASF